MRSSSYAAAVRALYEHPDPAVSGGVFRMSPDTVRSPDKHARIGANTAKEKPFVDIWEAAPDDFRAWALGRLSVTEPKAASALIDDVGSGDLWDIGRLGSRSRFLMSDEQGEVIDLNYRPVEGVKLDGVGNVIHADTGEPVDLWQ